MRSLEGLWFEDMEKKRKKKSGVDLSKTMASPSAPPPSVEPTSASTATPPPVEVATATPPPVEANVATDVSATKVAEAPAPPPPTSTPALSEASAEAVLAKVDLAKVAVPRSQDSSRKLVAAVELPPDPPARPEPRSEPTEVSTATPVVAPTPTPAIDVVTATPPPVGAATETPPPVSAAGGPVSKKKPGKKKKKPGDRPSVLPETTREPALERASKRKIAKAPEATSVPKAELDQKLEKLDQKLQEKKVEAEKAARAGFASTPDADDISVPPVDLDEHDHFFAAGEGAAQRQLPGASGSYDAVDPHHARKMTAEAKARRAHLSRYVKGAVIACAALLALGLLVSKLRTKDEPTPTVAVTHAPLPTPPPPLPTPTTENTAPPDDTATVAPDTSASAAASASAAPDTSASAAASASAAPDTSAKPAKTALQEKLDAKALLEREAYGAAVAAGERSVALDASDGETWLILGAAYQGMGNQGQAKRCYQTCTKQKRGPIADCQQMLQQ